MSQYMLSVHHDPADVDRMEAMTPEEMQQLFRQFYRIKNERTRSIPGTGLGLSIVKQIVESYHGDIDVESTPGEGTTFHVRLPVHYLEQE